MERIIILSFLIIFLFGSCKKEMETIANSNKDKESKTVYDYCDNSFFMSISDSTRINLCDSSDKDTIDEEDLSIFEYFENNSYRKFEKINDSKIIVNERDSMTYINIDIGHNNYVDLKIDLTSSIGDGNLPNIYMGNDFLSKASNTQYFSNDKYTGSIQLELHSLDFSNKQIYYHVFDRTGFLLLRTGYKLINSATIPFSSVWFLFSINKDDNLFIIIYDSSGLLSKEAFGDFNNNDKLDFFLNKTSGTGIYESDNYERLFIYNMLNIEINKETITKDSLFTFVCAKFGDSFKIMD